VPAFDVNSPKMKRQKSWRDSI